MTEFQYKARDKFGKLIEGEMGADSEKAVALKLESLGYVPVDIRVAAGNAVVGRLLARWNAVRAVDVNMFTRQLYTLQRAGVPLLSSLSSLRQQTNVPALSQIIAQVQRDIEAGQDLSTALGRHPRVFTSLYINMVRSGEVSGRLSEILERLAVLGEHEERIRMRVLAAVRYPAIVITAIIAAFLVLVTMVIPRFAKLYSQFSSDLPLPTRLLMGVHHVVTVYGIWIVLALIVAGIFLFRYVRTPVGRTMWDRLKLRVPVFGPLLLKLTMSRFCRMTGTLMRSGVPILQILELAEGTVGNVIVSRTIAEIRSSVNEGKGMSQPMTVSGLFPPIVTQMVAVGEETGKLDELLTHVSDYYDAQVEYTVNNMIALVEPFLVLVLGLVVLVMALGIFMPMWDMMHLFKRN